MSGTCKIPSARATGCLERGGGRSPNPAKVELARWFLDRTALPVHGLDDAPLTLRATASEFFQKDMGFSKGRLEPCWLNEREQVRGLSSDASRS
eukprot:6951502-Pyramimonas_sp.AAC.1